MTTIWERVVHCVNFSSLCNLSICNFSRFPFLILVPVVLVHGHCLYLIFVDMLLHILNRKPED